MGGLFFRSAKVVKGENEKNLIEIDAMVIPLVILMFIVSFCAIVWGATDYTCVNDCTRQGYMYSYCVSKCSYDTYRPKKNNIDYSCVSDCTRKGYLYSYCVDYCSY